jgi:hypothetical protein
MSCCTRTNRETPIAEWGNLVDETDLTDIQKKAIQVRVLSVVKRLRERLFRLTIGYTLLRTSTTVGSLLVPSLLAVQSNVDPMGAYWAMWGIGLVVSLSNAFVSLFRVDKNYFTVGDLIEKIESESWMYLTLSGRYKREDYEDEEEGIKVTGHRTQFSSFMERCEMMMNKAIRTEYIPGQVPSGSRSVTNDQHSFMGKRANRAIMSYETVPVQVDDKHNRSASGSNDPAHYVREHSVGSDSTIEDRGNGGVSTEGLVQTSTGSQGVPIEPENRRVYGHSGEGNTS